MRPRDWFSVGVRLIGVWIVQRAFVYVLSMLAERLTYQDALDASKLHHDTEAIYSIELLIFGFLLVFGAERVTKLVYREPEADELDDSHADAAMAE